MKAAKQKENVGGRKMGEPATRQRKRLTNVVDEIYRKIGRGELLLEKVKRYIEREIEREGHFEIPFDMISVREMKELMQKHGGYCDGDMGLVIIGGE